MHLYRIIVSLLLIGVVGLLSCNSRQASPKAKRELKQYWLVVTYETRVDSSIVHGYSDSAAYLSAKERFDSHKNDWELAEKFGFEEPLSFKLLKDGKTDVKDLLSSQTLNSIDTLAKITHEANKYNKYDSNGNIKPFDTSRPGLSDAMDSILNTLKNSR